ncbi:sensor histidine kinase [Nonomuraea sp. NPDC050328]|uniref:sensor histidine kinase n=1 Tax=Nonomuraea sp. NPDC050328 TaxID=3364361 RepID=UPI0037BDF784
MSLRSRLTATVVGLLALALVLVGGATFGALQDWRGPDDARLRALGGGPELLAAADELTHRVAMVLIGTSGFALSGLTLLAAWLVRRGLRPLDRMVAAAGAIGAGDLGRRVEPAPPETEVGRLARALNAMLGQLEGAFRERAESRARLERFVADASHELRTPIATIRGYAELFRRGARVRQDDLAKAMSRIESEAARMGALVEELLLLARLDQGRVAERRVVELDVLVAEAVADTLAVEPDRPLDLLGDGPVRVDGDAAQLRQAVGNLLANLLRHTPPGTEASVRVAAVDGRAVVEVADRGPGLEPGARVFERFHHRAGGGAGLGLSIVAAVAEAHGGHATAGPRPGGGAIFRLNLPESTGLPERPPPSESPAPSERPPPPESRRPSEGGPGVSPG